MYFRCYLNSIYSLIAFISNTVINTFVGKELAQCSLHPSLCSGQNLMLQDCHPVLGHIFRFCFHTLGCRVSLLPQAPKLSSLNVSESWVTIPDVHPLPTCTTLQTLRSSALSSTDLLPNFSLIAPYTPTHQSSVSQTVVRGPQVVLGFCPCGPFRLNISPKKTEKIKLT